MAKHPDVFPPLMVNMCRAGEVGGFLDMVLLQIAENYEAEVKLKGKVKAAMTYPVVVFIIAVWLSDRDAPVPPFRPSRKLLSARLAAPAGADASATSSCLTSCAGRSSVHFLTIVGRQCGNGRSARRKWRNVVDPLKLRMRRLRHSGPEDRSRQVLPQPRDDVVGRTLPAESDIRRRANCATS
jgi:type IV pilus assembly protein PilC